MVLRLGRPAPSLFPDIRLTGRRVVLRPPSLDDWPHWARLRQESRAHLEPFEPEWAPDALERESFVERLRRQAQEWRAGIGYAFLMFERAEVAPAPELVGGISLNHIRRGVAQTGTLGYWVGARFTGRGYTTEAVALVTRFAFADLALHRVEAACVPENAASQRVLTKCGFRQEGMARSYLRIAGSWRDHVLFARLAEDGALPLALPDGSDTAEAVPAQSVDQPS